MSPPSFLNIYSTPYIAPIGLTPGLDLIYTRYPHLFMYFERISFASLPLITCFAFGSYQGKSAISRFKEIQLLFITSASVKCSFDLINANLPKKLSAPIVAPSVSVDSSCLSPIW